MENCRGMQPRVTTCIDDSLWIKGEGGALAIKYYERSSTDRWIRSLPSSSFLIIKSKRKANSIFFFKIVSRCNRPVKKKKKFARQGLYLGEI